MSEAEALVGPNNVPVTQEVRRCQCSQAFGLNHNIACSLGGTVSEANYIRPFARHRSRPQEGGELVERGVAVAWMYENEAGERTFEFNPNGESARWLLENGYTETPLYTALSEQGGERAQIVAEPMIAAKAVSDLYNALLDLPLPTFTDAASEDYRRGVEAGWKGAVTTGCQLANNVFRVADASERMDEITEEAL